MSTCVSSGLFLRPPPTPLWPPEDGALSPDPLPSFSSLNNFYLLIYFTLGHAGSLLLRGLSLAAEGGAPLCCNARAYGGGFSCCGAQALGTRASVVVARTLVAPWHVGSSWIRE